MVKMYFLAVKDEVENKNIELLLPPIFFDENVGFYNLSLPNRAVAHYTINNEPFEKSPLLDSMVDVLNYAMHFPMRRLKTMKISGDNYIVIGSNYYKDNGGWDGITIYVANEDELPLKREMELSEKIFDCISGGLLSGRFNVGDLAEPFSEYLNRGISELFEEVWRQKYIEPITTMMDGDSRIWEISLHTPYGVPLGPIFRYNSNEGNIQILDMTQAVVFEGKSLPLETVHNLMCGAIGGCYSLIKDRGLGRLAHMSSLKYGEGSVFTFLEEINLKDNNFLSPSEIDIVLCVDVMNNKKGEKIYIDRLFGDEREIIKGIKRGIEQDKKVISTVHSLEKGQLRDDLIVELEDILRKVLL